jgi:hypothetical protein
MKQFITFANGSRFATASRFLLLPALFVAALSSCQKQTTPPALQPDHQTGTAKTTNDALASKTVTFTLLMDFSTNPAFGTFTATGAINTSGTAEFDYNPNQNFITAHNVITLTASEGTITIHDECEFAVDKAFPFGRGNYQIVGGTGAYANLAGNGAESFPSATEDILAGIIH